MKTFEPKGLSLNQHIIFLSLAVCCENINNILIEILSLKYASSEGSGNFGKTEWLYKLVLIFTPIKKI